MEGLELIAAERKRQVEKEGWTAEHDDKHVGEELALAAAAYAIPEKDRDYEIGDHLNDRPYPWPTEWWTWWKPCPDNRIRELVKAGALIAAEIDRRLRLGEKP